MRSIIVHSLTLSSGLLQTSLADFSPDDLRHRPSPAANAAAHIVGHLAWVEHLTLQELKTPDLPPIAPGLLDPFAMGQPPATNIPDPQALVALFFSLRQRTINTFSNLPDAALASPLAPPPHIKIPLYSTLGEAGNFVGLHTMFHTGQISAIRRSLGRPPMF